MATVKSTRAHLLITDLRTQCLGFGRIRFISTHVEALGRISSRTSANLVRCFSLVTEQLFVEERKGKKEFSSGVNGTQSRLFCFSVE